ncbi:hypothetical protein AURANDRAFT_66963 [Aureococcus anophagefferens]|uniref:ATP-citrate synthase ATP-grasp domain-containing protein n=1 Tax=Aureococcus anophagefferens TaxID=44056 RepID=F0YJG2_AURAN|nr:hypothetical protein AURANDRAFT_66963 [Aureococcus anophagefferens]EGB04786.1 hypothetical protein AURANDRAFT_66963 [Aureococcus anophagefferens]|eukprot:XP_009040522.1 hypothetical protein AURANDRAFT_66963 [Aureococcus anophagefferens]
MAAKPVREYFGKQLLAKYLGEASGGEFEFEGRGMLVKSGASDPASPSSWAALLAAHPWARDARLVAKPDQLIKRRGKAGLLAIDKSFDECRAWVDARMNATIDVEGVEGVLHTFLVEPFVPHAQADEYYVCVVSNREGEELLFCKDGGVDVGDVDAKAKRLQVPLGESAAPDALAAALLDGVPEARKPKLARFLATLLGVYRQLHFVYMEINPIGRVRSMETNAVLLMKGDSWPGIRGTGLTHKSPSGFWLGSDAPKRLILKVDLNDNRPPLADDSDGEGDDEEDEEGGEEEDEEDEDEDEPPPPEPKRQRRR